MNGIRVKDVMRIIIIMRNFKAILFDMDGTLLPMDMKTFTEGYFKFLCVKLAPFGIGPEKLIAAVWEGVNAMVKNDGAVKNEEVFWKRFEEVTGYQVNQEIVDTCQEFYGKEFHQAKKFTGENPLAVEAVKAARTAAPIVALATNPLFPMAGQKTRMSWIGLKAEDFDLVTSYESDTFCKPNPAYFISVCERLGVKPEECLMIGNDEGEDMYAASLAGIKDCYLVTDTMIPNPKHPWDGPKGTFSEMVEMLKNLFQKDTK